MPPDEDEEANWSERGDAIFAEGSAVEKEALAEERLEKKTELRAASKMHARSMVEFVIRSEGLGSWGVGGMDALVEQAATELRRGGGGVVEQLKWLKVASASETPRP